MAAASVVLALEGGAAVEATEEQAVIEAAAEAVARQGAAETAEAARVGVEGTSALESEAE